jgi:hypothetical protein
MPDLSPEKLLELVTVEESVFVWMAVHGNLCLALRNPGNRGARAPATFKTSPENSVGCWSKRAC